MRRSESLFVMDYGQLSHYLIDCRQCRSVRKLASRENIWLRKEKKWNMCRAVLDSTILFSMGVAECRRPLPIVRRA